MMIINDEAFYSESEIEARHGLAALTRIRDAHGPVTLERLEADALAARTALIEAQTRLYDEMIKHSDAKMAQYFTTIRDAFEYQVREITAHFVYVPSPNNDLSDA